MPQTHDIFMDEALVEARKAADEGNMGCGAVLVRDEKIIGRGRNMVTTGCDPTLHAEVEAIRDACRRLGSGELTGTTLYSTMEPCPMCLWAMIVGGVERLVLGGRHRDLETGVRTNVGNYSVEALFELTGRRIDFVNGVKNEECIAIRRHWRTS